MFWGTNVYKDVPEFLFFGYKNVSYFLEFHLKLDFLFFIFFLLPVIFKIWGPFHLGALGNGLVEGRALSTPILKGYRMLRVCLVTVSFFYFLFSKIIFYF